MTMYQSTLWGLSFICEGRRFYPEGPLFAAAVIILSWTIYLEGVLVHACNPSSWEAEAGGFRIQGYNSETLSQKKKVHLEFSDISI
jgi:hypothetical protein